MSRCIYIIAGILLLAQHQAAAQEVATGNVVIHSDARLAILLKKGRLYIPAHSSEAAANTTTPTGAAATTHHDTKPVYNGPGYRVQIYNGPDRAKAVAIKNDFIRRFPGIHTYLVYTAPAFRVKVGDYKSRSEAAAMLHEVNSIFSPCMIVPDAVSISGF